MRNLEGANLRNAVLLKTAIGAKVTMTPPAPGGLCTDRAPTGMVALTIRETKTGAVGDAELGAAGAQAKQSSIQMDVKKFGPITCTTMSPLKDVRIPFLTSCSVVKGTRAAVVEVTTRTQKDTVPIAKLRPLAERMASRF